MENFLYNFADKREPEYEFTWRRSGLIVGMVWPLIPNARTSLTGNSFQSEHSSELLFQHQLRTTRWLVESTVSPAGAWSLPSGISFNSQLNTRNGMRWWLGMYPSPDSYVFDTNSYTRRIISGFSIGGLSVMVPMYQGECSPSHIRGAIVW